MQKWDWNNLNEEDLINVLYTQIIRNPYIPVTPTEKQLEFLSVFNKETLYGGAAGGGKSAALLMAALMFVTIPGYNALLLRRTFADLSLPEALIPLSKDWLMETDAHWNENAKKWTFPSGATLTFGYLDTDKHKYRYQGAAFHFVGFDELTQFTEAQYTYLFSRSRKVKGKDIPLRFRSASNPGGVGHEWVKERFLDIQKKGRLFIPARLYDNPHLDHKTYEENLDELDPVTKMQLRDGDWDVVGSGNYFQKHKFKITKELPNRGIKVRYWDLAGTEEKEGKDPDYTVGVLMRTWQGQYWIEDVVRGRWNPVATENIIKETAEKDGADVNIWMEEEPGSAGKHLISHYSRNILPGYTFRGNRTTGSKAVKAQPFSAAVDNGNVHILKAPWNRKFLDECVLFPQPEYHDDQVDAASGAFEQLNNKGNIIIESIEIDRSSKITRGY